MFLFSSFFCLPGYLFLARFLYSPFFSHFSYENAPVFLSKKHTHHSTYTNTKQYSYTLKKRNNTHKHTLTRLCCVAVLLSALKMLQMSLHDVLLLSACATVPSILPSTNLQPSLSGAYSFFYALSCGNGNKLFHSPNLHLFHTHTHAQRMADRCCIAL